MSNTDPLDPRAQVTPGRGRPNPGAFGGGTRRLNNNVLWIGGVAVLIVLLLVGQGFLRKLSHKPAPASAGIGTGKDGEDATAQANKLIASAGPQPGAMTPGVGPAPAAALPSGTAATSGPPPRLTPQEQQALQQAQQARQAYVDHENSIYRAREAQFTQALAAPGGVRFAISQSTGGSGGAGGSAAASSARGVQVARATPAAANDSPDSLLPPGSPIDLLKRQLNAQAQAGIPPTPEQAAELQRLYQQQGASAATSGGGQDASGLRAGLTNKSGAYDQFGGSRNRWVSLQRVEAPVSPFELRAGFVIPGIMITGISSELPGQITSSVSQNVYDTATGRYLLVPQGSRLIGSYASDAAYGQTRVLVAWQRVVFPNGNALDIGSMAGSDSAGYSGFKDKVNNHYVRIFGSALLLSAINGLVYLGENQQNQGFGTSVNTQTAFSQSLGQELSETSNELIRKNLSISPTLEIRPGFKFNVVVMKDLVFDQPYVVRRGM